jgi:hypothetical protein
MLFVVFSQTLKIKVATTIPINKNNQKREKRIKIKGKKG